MKKTLHTIKAIIKIIITGLIFLIQSSLIAQDISISELEKKAMELGIDESHITRIQERARANGLSEERLAEILEPAVALAEENLPFDMILEKASEGLAKRVPDQTLINVLQGIQQATRESVDIVDPWIQQPNVQQMINRSGNANTAQNFRNNMIRSTGRALHQGMNRENITGFLDEIDNDDVISRVNASQIVTSLHILPDLPATADNPELSGQMLVRSLKGGFNSEDLQKLPAAMRMAQSRGQLPAGNIVNGILQQLQVGTPAQDILQSLFDGRIGGGPPAGIPGRPDNPPGRGNNGGSN